MNRLFSLTSKGLALAFVFVVLGNRGQCELITFDPVFSTLPYTEGGLTFTNLGTSLAVVSGGGLVAGTNFDPIHVRATGSAPFDLISFDVRQLFQNWQVVSSTGATLTPSLGTMTLTGLSGWQGITYFDLIHDPPQVNGTIRVDDFQIQFVPEPSAIVLGSLAIVGLLIAARRKRFRS